LIPTRQSRLNDFASFVEKTQILSISFSINPLFSLTSRLTTSVGKFLEIFFLSRNISRKFLEKVSRNISLPEVHTVLRNISRKLLEKISRNISLPEVHTVLRNISRKFLEKISRNFLFTTLS
jgi:hypothetical protein